MGITGRVALFYLAWLVGLIVVGGIVWLVLNYYARHKVKIAKATYEHGVEEHDKEADEKIRELKKKSHKKK